MAACTPRICLQSTSGPQVVSGWDHIGTAQAVAFQTMKGLSFKNSRIILMAKQEDFRDYWGPSSGRRSHSTGRNIKAND